MYNGNSSKGRRVATMNGPLRSPMAGCLPAKPNLHPSIAANTTTSGISKQSAPIRSPMSGGNIVKYGR